jgi:carbamate kinase
VKIIIALGGHALCPPEPSSVAAQRAAVKQAVVGVAALARHHDVIVTHGNGPQVGWLAAQAGLGTEAPTPLDLAGAESEGAMGYLLEQELENALVDREAVALLTQVEVAADDPAFANPSKPIGPLLDAEAQQRLLALGRSIGPSRGGMRRLVPSPEPRRIVELRSIALLLRLGVLVVCSGGGGIPVVRDEHGALSGVEAVIDKDRTAKLLGVELAADHLLLLTDVPGVYRDWPERKELIREAAPHHLQDLPLEAGSMAPKVEAARHFVQGCGGIATIGSIDDAERMLSGAAGTRIDASVRELALRE